MPSSFAAIVDARSRLFDLTVFGAGMAPTRCAPRWRAWATPA